MKMPEMDKGGGKSAAPEKVLSSSFKLRLSKKTREIARELAGIGLSAIEQSEQSLTVRTVDGTDIEGRASKYFQAEFSKGGAKLTYTVSGGENPARRKAEAAGWLLHVLSSSSAFSLPEGLMQFVSSALGEASSLQSSSTDALSSELFALKEEHASLRARHAALALSHEGQSRALAREISKSESLQKRLSELSKLPPDALDGEVMAHLNSHEGKMNIAEFSSRIGVSAPLVEESLARLARGGLIARIK